jgi:transcriptional regulator with XRE-family HTH domain
MTLKEKLTQTPEGLRTWHQERTLFDTANVVCELMNETGVSRSELAERLGKSRGYITQLLDGRANMTLRTVSDVFVALGRQFHPAHSPLEPLNSAPTGDVDFEFKAQINLGTLIIGSVALSATAGAKGIA